MNTHFHHELMIHDIIDVHVEKIIVGGQSFARYNGKVILFTGGLPNETCRISIEKNKKGYALALLQHIIVPSPYRIVAPCQYYNQCGGCQLQHIEYTEQLCIKSAVLQEALNRMGVATIPAYHMHGMTYPWNYRNRMRLHQTHDKKWGFYAYKQNTIREITHCLVVDTMSNEYLQIISEAQNNYNTTEVQCYSTDKQVFSTAEYSNTDSHTIQLHILQKNIYFNVFCFFQSNRSMLTDLLQWYQDKITLVSAQYSSLYKAEDLYAGVGLFAAFLPEQYTDIQLVEINDAAISFMHNNVVHNKKNCTVHTAHMSVEQWALKQEGQGECIIIDPPRTGMSKIVRTYICQHAYARIIVMISCDIASFARDYAEIIACGYECQHLQMFDMYPHTYHAEIVAIVTRKERI